jgi:hypothetical protein
MKMQQVEWMPYGVAKGPDSAGNERSEQAGHCAVRVRTDDGAWRWSELHHSKWDWDYINAHPLDCPPAVPTQRGERPTCRTYS